MCAGRSNKHTLLSFAVAAINSGRLDPHSVSYHVMEDMVANMGVDTVNAFRFNEDCKALVAVAGCQGGGLSAMSGSYCRAV